MHDNSCVTASALKFVESIGNNKRANNQIIDMLADRVIGVVFNIGVKVRACPDAKRCA